ncbi:heparinase II/III domain-containing protein [Adhaeribacter radiodurans]|uniref:Heparinase II/III family protein n=1 Tax=Adhaeribacter radiodurans TaxID=2745197 RepID=A0A7L7L3N5_9BACT|nr:heparinase II/III family protein [Adhaeribacter radiodurans]QMU27384.1 heparinase II/III family protein [Adhaeribacter radiodurans]
MDTREMVALTPHATTILNSNIFTDPRGDVKISNLRPRLFVRADEDKTGVGLTISELRLRSEDSTYKDWINYTGGINGWESLPAMAMQYLLKGDKKIAQSVGEYIANTPYNFGEHTSAAAMVYNSAIAFDWVRMALPKEMASKICARLVEGAEHLKGGVVTPSINHNYTFVSMYGVAMAAMAIHGESDAYDQKAAEYLSLLNQLLLDDHMLFATLKAKQGTWGEGNHYTPFVVFYPMLMTLNGLSTATSRDYFSIIRENYDDFLVPMSKFIIANFRPDFTMERIGDVTTRVVPHKSFLRPFIDLMALKINDQTLQGQIHSFSKQLSVYYGADLVSDPYHWMMLVNYNAKIPDKPAYTTLPTAMRLGENSYEHIMFRSDWSENGTLITYLSGDHYTDHQHFDKGHFLIYKNGALVVDGGGYSKMYSDSWSNYSIRTLAHNNVLVYDPKEFPGKEVNKTEIHLDGGQRIIRGAQALTSWKEFNEKAGALGLHTASVLAFDADKGLNRYNYVKSNLTNAYGEKVTWMDRQLFYLPQADFLVVKDRVITPRPLDNYWLLHFEERPTIDGKIPEAGVKDYQNASIVHSQRTGTLSLEGQPVPYSGSLFVKTLTPNKRTISLIGGPGYEYYNRFSKKNFTPEKPFLQNRESGNWRMEVSPEKPRTGTAFLHAFQISDSSKKEMIATEYLRTQDGKLEGAFFRSEQNSYLVMFSSSLDAKGHEHQTVNFPLKYKVKAKTPVNHVLAELTPNRKVKVIINNKNKGTFQTSSAGVLYFNDESDGVRRIQILAD